MTHKPKTRWIAVLLALALALTVAACGGNDNGSSGGSATTGSAKLKKKTSATLVLDFVPNAVHAGIYRAVAQGYYKDNNIDLKIIKPTSTSDTLKLIDAGKAQIGIADGIDVASQIDSGRGVKGIMALTERPLGAIITLKKKKIADPSQLDGKTVGITGVPSDTGIGSWIVNQSGGDWNKVNRVTVGFNGVQNLENGKVDGFVGYGPADGVQVEVDGFPTTQFPLYKSGAPSYPGLVVFSTQDEIKADPALLKAFVAATVKGYNDTLKNPNASLNDLLAENPSLKQDIAKAQLDAYLPLFKGSQKQYGIFDDAVLTQFSNWLVNDVNLLKKQFTAQRYATNQFVQPTG